MDKTIQEIQQYAVKCENTFKESLKRTGYKTLFPFYKELSIAEYVSGENGVIETVQRVIKEWLQNIKAITEFVLSLNYKTWESFNNGNMKRAQLYARMFHHVFAKVEMNYEQKPDDLSYFYTTID